MEIKWNHTKYLVKPNNSVVPTKTTSQVWKYKQAESKRMERDIFHHAITNQR